MLNLLVARLSKTQGVNRRRDKVEIINAKEAVAVKMKINRSCAVVVSFAVLICAVSELGLCRGGGEEEGMIRTRVGGIHGSKGYQNSGLIESLGQFAVEEYNKRENALLEFTRVVKSREKVVAGKLYYLTLEVIDAGKKKVYEAKVWVKPWMNFKKLEDFKFDHDVPHFTTSDLGLKQGFHKLGWRAVPTHDPEVREAANHAIKILQQRVNCLCPYQLLEILLSEAEVIGKTVRFQLRLKLKRGTNVEEFTVLVNKNHEGKYYLN
ncbi:hypothetical protein SAY87_031381 [Trapa incisa]|uniref:Cysteine proteinase inhibitor n=1 Tax=Trapa incisa TaxID=236973 RepID=A0AAN7KT85_9MYRT|nr:hypothetical protein SAY87_031381 [Trapa incisa]